MVKSMAYCDEEDVYDATGLNSDVIQKLGEKSEAEVTILVNKCIAKADKRIKRLLKVPVVVRKEPHRIQKNETVALGSYEDEFGFFGVNEPENCVEVVYAIFQRNGRRIKLPYPKDCDKLSEDVTDMDSTDCILTKETTDVKCGTASIEADFEVDGMFSFPLNANLNKNIAPWMYIGFWWKTDTKAAEFTIRLYKDATHYNSHTFSCEFDDTWELIALKIGSFTGDISWGYGTSLQKIEIYSNAECICLFDNFNFNDGLFWTYPEGLICWSVPDSEPYFDIEVTYAYDPYKSVVPSDLEEASALLAGVKLLDYCIGCRQRITAFKQRAYDLDTVPDRETLEVTRVRLKREAMQALAGIGFGTMEH